MRTLLALLASAPLFLAATAHAETIRVLAPPSDDACHEEVKGKKADKQLARLTEWLGSDRTRDAWKELRDFGQPGTHTIAKWISNGAQGGDRDDTRGAGEWLIRCGMGEDFDVGVTALLEGNHIGPVSALLGALAPRLPRFTTDQAQLWVASTNNGVRERAIRALVGQWRVRGIATGSLFFEDSPRVAWDVTQEDLAPPQHHIEAVLLIAKKANHPGVWNTVVSAIGDVFEENVPHQGAWGLVLETAVQLPGEDHDKQRWQAAYWAARYQSDSLEAIIEHALASREKELHVHLMDGFDDRAKEDELGPEARDHLARLAGLSTKGEAKRAEKLLKKVER